MIVFDIPFFPPTTNHAYVRMHGVVRLSEKGRAFKSSVTGHIVGNAKYLSHLRDFQKNKPYGLIMRMYFPEGIENSTYPKTCGTRYKKTDVTNRIKLAEDAICEALGIDDSQFLVVHLEKHKGNPDTPRFEAIIWDYEKERPPLP